MRASRIQATRLDLLSHYPHLSYGIAHRHSVYSFFLLNVKATLDRGVLYPAKAIWEDIEFLHMVNEANLVVCKVRFSLLDAH
jgi:hypothetical protein